jgi:hypothetical protein
MYEKDTKTEIIFFLICEKTFIHKQCRQVIFCLLNQSFVCFSNLPPAFV